MQDYSIIQGETLRLTVTVTEEGATTAYLFAYDDLGNVIESTATFDGLVADLSTSDTDVPDGEYEYYVRVFWDDGSNDVLTKRADCDGEECEMPIITVCPLEQPGSS